MFMNNVDREKLYHRNYLAISLSLSLLNSPAVVDKFFRVSGERVSWDSQN